MTRFFYSFESHNLPVGSGSRTLDPAPEDWLTLSEHINRSQIDLRELSDLLRRQLLPLPFRLAICTEDNRKGQLADTVTPTCHPIADRRLCDSRCIQQWEDLIDLAMVSGRPQIHCCAQGFLGFAIPLPGNKPTPACLLGGGVRLRQPVTADAAGAAPGQPIQDKIPVLPGATRAEAQRLADEIARQLPQLLDQQLQKLSLAHISERLSATREIVRELACCTSAAEAISMVSEALVVLFDLPRVIFIMQQAGRQPAVHTAPGLEPADVTVDDGRLAEFFNYSGTGPLKLSGKDLAEFLTGQKSHRGLLFPLRENAEKIGLLLVLDIEPHPRDQALIELLAGRLAARLLHLRQEAMLRRERHLSTRLLAMISGLALADNREKFHQELLEMSAELINATSGSLMLFDEQEQKLLIAAAKGMSPPLSRSMAIPLGKGIAGRVARGDTPLLVNDIERDSRTATPNRPRFRTKSFISLPLRDDRRLIGVLNLADRQDGPCFTEADLSLVLNFACQAMPILDRIIETERIEQLEKLAMTDPLTGLYNRRFLDARLEEEISRSQRQGKPFSLILADLDNFKLYNDICGHIAGDRALCRVATVMNSVSREMDVAIRYGGEEFCLILPITGKKEAFFAAERLRQAIEAAVFPGETNLPLGRMTISAGIATYPDDGTSMHALLSAADLALYRAKELGRNRSISSSPAKSGSHPERVQLSRS